MSKAQEHFTPAPFVLVQQGELEVDLLDLRLGRG